VAQVTGRARSQNPEWNGFGQPGAAGLTDLMTSLAVIFVLLLVVVANVPRAADPPKLVNQPAGAALVRGSLKQAMQAGLALEPDPEDPQVLRVVIPERFLNFDFGRATLTPSADRFLAGAMPAFAVAVCGAPRPLIAAIVIEGHTDDLGGDALNLRLSQERSLQVLVRGLEAIQASVPSAYACFGQLTSASGRGRQDIIYDAEKRPNRGLSRRVIFKILLRPGAAA
jgi:outer membrane protein OmpA-like peptidoglycan-associated protein